MNETECQKGRLEALSLIVRAIVTAHNEPEPAPLGPRLIRLANQYFLDVPFDMHTVEFRSGFFEEVRRIVAILDAPVGGVPTGARRTRSPSGG